MRRTLVIIFCRSFKMNRCGKLAASILLTLLLASSNAMLYSTPDQDATTSQAGTRIELLEEQQREKARNLPPAKPNRAEQFLEKYIGDDPLNKYAGGIPGLHLRLGGTPRSAGFSIGPEYVRPDLAKGQMTFRATAVASTKLWYLIETELRFPHFTRRYSGPGFHGAAAPCQFHRLLWPRSRFSKNGAQQLWPGREHV